MKAFSSEWWIEVGYACVEEYGSIKFRQGFKGLVSDDYKTDYLDMSFYCMERYAIAYHREQINDTKPENRQTFDT
jgi:hypothetical protein